MKIGLVIYGSLGTVSGGYLYDRKLVEYLQKQGNQVEILSIPWRNYPQHLLDNLSSRFLESMLSMEVDVLLQDELVHPSLAWTNSRWHTAKSREAFQSPTYKQPPVIAIVHHLRSSEMRPRWQNRFYAWVERHYLRSVDGFIYNSQTTKHEVGKQIQDSNLPRGIIALPAGDRFKGQISVEEIQQRARLAVPLQLVFIGNLIPRKGLHTLLQALTRIRQVDYQLSVIGDTTTDPTYFRQVQILLNNTSLTRRVQLLGSLDDAELEARLRASHLLVIPSSYEGYGIAYLEGMCFGLPAIACASGATREIITPEKNGLLVPPGDPLALAEAIEYLGSDRALLAAFGLAARRRFLEQPGWEYTGEQIREFLLSV